MGVVRYSVTLWSHLQTGRNKKPVTFEPFELQKRQSTKNDSILHQKFIYAIRKTKYTVVPAEKRWQILCPNYHYFNSTTSFYWFQYCVYLYTNYKQINFQILFNYCHSHSLSWILSLLVCWCLFRLSYRYFSFI